VEIRRILDREDLTHCFAAIIAADDVSASKPDPETYTRAVEAIAARHGPLDPKHCVAIEDSIWGLESARRAGLRTVAVAHTYGASHLEDADLVVSSLHDLALDQLDGLCRD
jgi:beta-phosphoglucomutase-like phosphatase (HAD superfamily)